MSQSRNVIKEVGLLSSGPTAVVSSNQALSPFGATPLNSSAGAIACTLAIAPAGTQKTLIQVGTGTNNVVVTSRFLTVNTLTTSATFDAAGESLTLVSTGTAWQVVANVGTVTLA